MTLAAGNAALAAAIERDVRWASVAARDHRADGRFYYSVKTTGVYCRPSCPARLARPEHVRFHATWREAEQAGFRPCKRCRPNQASTVEQHAARIAHACRLIEESEKTPRAERLARHAGLSMYHFHRLFKATTGLTPKAYGAAHRAKRAPHARPE